MRENRVHAAMANVALYLQPHAWNASYKAADEQASKVHVMPAATLQTGGLD